MNGQSNPRSIHWVVAIMLGLTVLLSAAPAFAAAPTQPVIKDTWVSGVAKVSLRWEPSRDASGHAVGYDVYRDVIPVTAATITSRSLTPVVTNYAGTTIEINASAAEVAQSYVWFYAVVARDDQVPVNYSAPSKNMQANLHGYRPSSESAYTVTCLRCHSVHGAYQIDYHTEELCYMCHGGTSASSAVGAKSSLHTQRYFFDYDGQTAGSQHRNQWMTDNDSECAACHTPHRSPYFYDAAGVYQASQSYRKMLRAQTAATPAYAYFGVNSDTAENTAFCLACHGADSAQMALGGGPAAYGATGGDHNSAGYATAAHGTDFLKSNDADTSFPQVQCLACHDNHAAAADKLIDYRKSRTSDASQWAGANLCFECHSGLTSESKYVAANTTPPFSWNGRDVRAQFVSKTSKHPYTLTTGTPTPTHHQTFAQTTKVEFETNTLSNTMVTEVDNGEITLHRPVNDPAAEPILFGQRGDSSSFDEYTPRTAAWNDLYNPAGNSFGWNPRSGSSAFVVNGKFYMTRGDGSNNQGCYDPSTNTWSTVTNLPDSVRTGGDSAVNARDGLVYYLRGDSNSRVMWWDHSGTSTGRFDFRTAGSNRTLGIGAAMAYAPIADRLFIIWSDDSSGDERLYWRTSPGNSTSSVDFSQGPVVIRSANGVYSRMTYFTSGGTEYLFVISQDTAGNNDSMLIHTIGGTPVVRELNNGGPFNAALADGCDLEWDGGDYLYAIRGGGNTGFSRIRIPTDPVNGTWDSWESLPNPPWGSTWPIGSSIAIGIHDEPAAYGDYVSSGTATSVEIAPYDDAYTWGTASWTESQPANTSLTVTVQGWDGTGWQNLVTAQDTGPIDLTAYSTDSYTRLRLRGDFATSDVSVSSALHDWTVTSVYDRIVVLSGSLTCVNCHNVHSVKAEKSSGAWDMDRVSDPDNTKNPAPATTVYGSTTADFCMRCHDGSTPSATISTSTLVPYTPAFTDRTEPYFPGWNKAESGFSFASSGHMAAAAADGRALCETCHDPHASDNLRLTAWTLPSGVTWANGNSIAGVRANTVAAAGEQNLCYKCHGDGSASYPRANGAKNVYTKAKLANAHDPDDYAGQHRDTEAASAQAGDATTRHAECTDCHDPHVATRAGGSATHTLYSSVSGPAIWGAYGAKPTYATSNWGGISSFSAERLTGASTSFEAYLCFKCHSSNVGTIPTGQTDIAAEFNPSNFSYHNVLGQSIGMKSAFSFTDSSGTTQNRTWSLPSASSFLKSEWVNNGGVNAKMTCTDCHDGYRDTGTPDPTTMARGPHGSSVDWLLDPDYSNWTNTTSLQNYSGVICGKCHTNLATSNRVHDKHDSRGNEGGYCRFCHIKVPHGWKRPRMLGYTTDGPYATISGGITQIRANKDYTPNNWSKGGGGDCSAGCDNTHPSTLSGATYWP
ncbi:MAG: hypothetical protein Kow0067_14970 [Coriobacteriia bacterium]